MGVPTFYTRLLAEPELDARGLRDDAALRLGLGAAARRDPRRVRATHRPAHPRALRHDGDRDAHFQPPRRASAAPAPWASPLPGTEVRVVDDDGPRRAPPGTIGHVQVRGANVFAGYWRMPEKNREEFTADGFFRTGDVGSLLAGRLPDHRRGARRTSSSPAATTSIRRRSSSPSTSCPACRNRRSWACRIPTSARPSPRSSLPDPARPAPTRGRGHRGAEEQARELQGAQARLRRRRAAAERHGKGPEERVSATASRDSERP